MGPAVRYTVLRMALLLVALVVVSALGAGPLLSIALAAVISMLLSYLVLQRQRDALTAVVAAKVEQRVARRAAEKAVDTAAEDAAADAAAQPSANPTPNSRP